LKIRANGIEQNYIVVGKCRDLITGIHYRRES
jgi:hypothetical protein